MWAELSTEVKENKDYCVLVTGSNCNTFTEGICILIYLNDQF